MTQESRCANPDCPTNPVIDEDPGLTLAEREDCPACGSRDRVFSATITDAAGWGHLELSGGGAVKASAVIQASGFVDVMDVEPQVRLASLEGVRVDYEVTLRWVEMSEGNPGGRYLFELVNGDGVPLITAHGDSPFKAMLRLPVHAAPGVRGIPSATGLKLERGPLVVTNRASGAIGAGSAAPRRRP